MKKFLISTALFTAISYVVQWVMDFVSPLQETPSSSQFSLSSLTNLDSLASNPEAIDALQAQLSNTDGLNRMVQVMIITSVLMAIWSVYRLFRKVSFRRSIITWSGNKHFLSIASAAPTQVTTSDNILMHAKPSCRILYFVYKGTNAGRKPLRDIDGYIMSTKTRLKIPLLLDGMASSGQADIPGHSDFLVMARFTSPTLVDGYSVEEFWREFGPFKLVFGYNDKQYEHVFDKKTLEALINKRVKELKY